MKKGTFLRLVGFECRKAFLSPMMLVFLVFLLLLNGWKIHDSYRQKVEQWEDYDSLYVEFYERYTGQITEEKVTHLMTIYGPLEEKLKSNSLSYMHGTGDYTLTEAMDENFFSSLFVTEMRYDYLYQNQAYRIAENARELAALYGELGNNYEAAKNEMIAKAFSGRKITQFADTRGWEVLLKYDYSSMLVLLLTVFGLCGVFVTERETEMYMLLRTNRNGTGVTVAAKLTACALFIVSVCALFFAQDFLTIYFASGRNGALTSPVYALRTLENTPLNMTVGQYFLWSACMKTVGIFGIGCVVLLLSSVCKQVLTVFFSSIGVILCCVVLQEFCESRLGLRWFNPLELVIVRDTVTEDVFANILGFSVRCFVLVLAGVVLAEAVLFAAILYFNRSYHSRGGRRRRNVCV